jgi:lipopolysaccharide export system permease protein
VGDSRLNGSVVVYLFLLPIVWLLVAEIRAMKRLTRYLAREIYYSIAVVFSALLMLYTFMNFIEELGDLGRGTYHLGYVFIFIGLLIPTHIYELFPLAVLIGTVFALVQMAGNSELTIYRSSGASLWQMLGALFKIGLPMVLVCIVIGEWLAPVSEHWAQKIRLKAQNAEISLKEFRSGVWVKDGPNFVNVRNVLPDATLLNISIYEFDTSRQLTGITLADRATIVGKNRWQLEVVRQTLFNEHGTTINLQPSIQWDTAISPNIFNVMLRLPEKMSAYDLFQYTKHLRDNSQKTGRYEIAMWNKIVYPIAVWIMLLLALPFAALQRRQGGVSGKIFVGIALGLCFHFVGRLFSSLGVLNDWSPFWSATLISWLFLGAALAMLWKTERR